MGRPRQERQGHARRDARRRRGDGVGQPAAPRHPRDAGQEAPHERRPRSQAKGHRHLHAPAGDDDEGRCAAAAGLRHRRPRQPQPQADAAADRHPLRRRDRHQPVSGVSQAPDVFRRPVLQPGRGRRGGRYSGGAARSPGDLPGKDAGDQAQDQVGADVPGRRHRRCVRGADRDHDLRDPGVQGRVQVVRRRPARANADRHRA